MNEKVSLPDAGECTAKLKQLESVIEDISDGLMLTDAEGNVIRINSAGLDMLSLTREQALKNVKEYDRAVDLYLLDGRPLPREDWPLTRILRGHTYRNLEIEVKNKITGKSFLANINGSAIYDENKNLKNSYIIFRDITRQKQNEQALKQAKESAEHSRIQIEAILNSMTEGLVIFDPQGNLIYMNPAGLAIHGFDSVERLKQHLTELPRLFEIEDLDGNILPVEDWPIGRALAGETFTGYEVRVIRTDGSKQWIGNYGGSPVRDSDGNIILSIVTLRDITEQKRIQNQLERSFEEIQQRSAELQQAHDIFNALMKYIPMGITVVNTPEVTVQAISRYALETTGNERKELTDISLSDFTKSWKLLYPDGKPAKKTEYPLYRAVKNGEILLEEEWLLVRPDGSRIPILTTAAPIRKRGGEIVGGVLGWQNISERKNQEKILEMTQQQQKRLSEQLEKNNEELRSIIGVVSHDLRTPLTTIKGFGHLIAKSCREASKELPSLPNEKMRKMAIELLEKEIPHYVEYIERGASSMNQFVESLVQVARVGLTEINPELLNMNELIQDVKANLEYSIQQAQADLTIEKLPPCYADRMQMNQILSNLLGNALKYLDPSRPGKIRISGYTEGFHSIYCVEDNGTGIPAKHHQKIFELFVRLREKEITGEGIGLPMVKRMLDRNNGTIWLRSTSGKGSKFCIKLPKSI